jgi:RNA polymerase sigma-70 factor, ECF subfamily
VENGRVRQALLVLRAQIGDEDAFEALFREFGPRTRRYLHHLLGDAAAEDAQQEVWVSVYRRIASLSDPDGFRGWLFRIARNQAVDQIRRRKRERVLLGPEGLLGIDDEAAAEPIPDVDFRIDRKGLAAAMSLLSPEHREALHLRYWEDLSYPEISLLVGAPVGTVRSRLHHAKRALRQRLEEAESQVPFT